MEDKKYIQNQFKKIAVLLVNFGGPDSLSSIKPFLYSLFSDPVVLNFPALYRKSLAWLISNLRNQASSKMYKKIGPMSPLIPITYLQAEKLQALFNINNLLVDVFISFRYCKPLIENVLDEIKEKGYKKVVVLPLYPQYSFTTTGSVELIVKNWLVKERGELELLFIKEWYKDEDYIDSYVYLIEKSLNNLDLRSTEMIFSAHSIPMINIKKGDPYQRQIIETAEEIIRKLNWKRRYHVTYQSKVGPIKWLEPATNVVIKEIGSRNKNANILVVPISFVCEHVETIFEIGKLYKDIAIKSGIKKFLRVPSLNTDKYLIQALYNQVVNCLEKNKVDIKEVLITK
ncbi:MAG: ferrochelatase [Candidatus Melainabacteria bacterium]|nr:ferrochelatase [Candidatus Melainabacteria bacterium]